MKTTEADLSCQDDGTSLATAKGNKSKGRVITSLAELPDKTLLDETALAEALHTCKRTIRRMVLRFELPPATRFAGRSMWEVGSIHRWFQARSERAAKEAEKTIKRIDGLSPAAQR